jgi:hypothetical protein
MEQFVCDCGAEYGVIVTDAAATPECKAHCLHCKKELMATREGRVLQYTLLKRCTKPATSLRLAHHRREVVRGERDGGQGPCAVTGYGPQPGNLQALVIITVEFDGPTEAMTFTVLVPNDGDEGMVRDQAISRAQDLARRFAESRRGN